MCLTLAHFYSGLKRMSVRVVQSVYAAQGKIIRQPGVNFHSYADDTQLYIMSPKLSSPSDKLIQCIDHPDRY